MRNLVMLPNILPSVMKIILRKKAGCVRNPAAQCDDLSPGSSLFLILAFTDLIYPG